MAQYGFFKRLRMSDDEIYKAVLKDLSLVDTDFKKFFNKSDNLKKLSKMLLDSGRILSEDSPDKLKENYFYLESSLIKDYTVSKYFPNSISSYYVQSFIHNRDINNHFLDYINPDLLETLLTEKIIQELLMTVPYGNEEIFNKYSYSLTSTTPLKLRKDKRIIMNTIKNVYTYDSFEYVDETLKNDPEFIKYALNNGAIEWIIYYIELDKLNLILNDEILDILGDKVIRDLGIKDLNTKEKIILHSIIFYHKDYLNKPIKEIKGLENIKLNDNNTTVIQYILNNADFSVIRYAYVVNEVIDFVQNKELVNKMIDMLIASPCSYLDSSITSSLLKSNKKYIIHSIKQDLYSIKYASKDLQTSLFIKELLESGVNPKIIDFIDSSILDGVLTDEVIDKLIEKRYTLSKDSPEVLRDKKEIIKKSIQDSWVLFQYVSSKRKKDILFIKQLLEEGINPQIVDFVDSSIVDEVLNDEVIDKLIENDYKLSSKSPKKLKTNEIFALNSLKQNCTNMANLDDKYYTSSFILKALESGVDPQVIDYVKPEFIDAVLTQEVIDKLIEKKYMLSSNSPIQIIEGLISRCSLENEKKSEYIVCLKYLFENNIIISSNIEDYIIPENLDKVVKIIFYYREINDNFLKEKFRKYIVDNFDNFADIDTEKIKCFSKVLSKISVSNSSEIFSLRQSITEQILKTDNPLETLDKIEDIFIKNNLPTVGKIYACFDILHPNFQGFDFNGFNISPVLKKSSTYERKIIVFSDLIKSAFGSNNKSVREYLKNIEFGDNLFESIKFGKINLDLLNEEEKKELYTFSMHLITLYNNTNKAKNNRDYFVSTGDILKDIIELAKKISPNGTLEYNLGDRVIRMFCGFAGIDTLQQAKEYLSKKINDADRRNRNDSMKIMALNKGDFVKGIGDVTYLRNILQNGSVAKEYLGASAGTDSTPLDTDISIILTDDPTIKGKISKTAAYNYGPIYLVLKNDERFINTRDSKETFDIKRDLSKLETFYTGFLGSGHYGIRTGFASSEINYIVMENYDSRVGLEIAMNGFYIPVANMEGKIIFTPKDYDELREKMSGLSYYDMPKYNISKNLSSPEIEETKMDLINAMEQTNSYNQLIKYKITEALKYAGIEKVVEGFNNNLVPNLAEIYSTGSTARNTNVPYDSDFDYLIKVDREILLDNSKLMEFKNKLKEKLNFTDGPGGKVCGTISLENGDKLDVEISICPRTDKVELSTDTSLSEKLNAIKSQFPEYYEDVLANIVYAKRIFKQINAYKSLKSDSSQGGFGGIGIENWILQNGGSFYDAAKDFLEQADLASSFLKFKEIYQVWDFGDNHYSEENSVYAHDNFVGGYNKMGEEGYEKIVQTLREYLNRRDLNEIKNKAISR